MPRTFFVGGNWKCNGTRDSLKALCETFNAGPSVADAPVEVVIGCPYVYCDYVRGLLRPDVALATQNCWIGKGGAITGEISVEMIKDCGIEWIIIGHSERRSLPELAESDETCAIKCAYAVANGCKVMACIGETLEEREAGNTMKVCEKQLKAYADKLKPEDWANIVIAYEPVWAIGTGKVATPEQAQDVHEQCRAWVSANVSADVGAAVRILYGGSVAAKNCKDLGSKPDIDGFLIGGASMKPEFLDCIDAHKCK